MSDANPRKIVWWLEFLRALIAAAAGILGGSAMV